MMGTLYRYLLHLHPPRFRERFEEEMLLVFGDAHTGTKKLWLVSDAVLSLVRQWALRPHHDPVRTDSPAVAHDGVPMFMMLEYAPPRPTALLFGALLSSIVFTVVLTTSYLAEGYSRLGYAVVGIHLSWGWDRAESKPLETPARQRLHQWLDAYNTGDAAALQRFTSQYALNFERYPGTNTPNVEYWTKLFQRVGPLLLHSVRDSRSDGIVGVAQAKDGNWWWIRLRISNDDDYRVLSITGENLTEARTPPKE
jgi:hypothetical protein